MMAGLGVVQTFLWRVILAGWSASRFIAWPLSAILLDCPPRK